MSATTMSWSVDWDMSARTGSARAGNARVGTARVGTARAGHAGPGAAAAAGAGLRLTRRGRMVVALVALAAALGAALSAQTAAADDPGAALPVATHTVAAGETLWEIAGTVAAPGQDRRDVVDRLVELNGLASASLQAGQQIIVPVP